MGRSQTRLENKRTTSFRLDAPASGFLRSTIPLRFLTYQKPENELADRPPLHRLIL